MKKATSWEDKYSEIEKAYRYALEVGECIYNLLGIKDYWEKKPQTPIQEAIKAIEDCRDKLRNQIDKDILKKVFIKEEYNPNKVLLACDLLLESFYALTEISQGSVQSIPANLCLSWYLGRSGELGSRIALPLVNDPFPGKSQLIGKKADRAVELLLPSKLRQSHSEELGIAYRSLPGILAYENSLELSKPKKSRSPEAIQKEKDLLYLLDQYESWKAKTTEKTRKKRLNSKDWLECRKQWPEKTEKLFVKYADQLLDDEIEIENLLDNARKYRKRRKKRVE